MAYRLIAVAALAVVIAAVAYGVYHHQEKEDVRHELVLQGNVDIRQVELGFRVPGRISDMRFEEGDAVKQGQLMAALDKAPFNADMAAAEAQVAQAKVTLANAETLFERQKALVGSGSVSKQDFDNALAAEHKAKAALEVAQARQESAKVNLDDADLHAPADGIIFTRIHEPGAIVSAGQSVYALSLRNPVWIRAYVNEPDLGRLKLGMPASVATDTAPEQPLSGKVTFISPDAEFTPKNVETQELRTDLVYRIRVLVNDPQGKLLQGMPVTVTISAPDDRSDERAAAVVHNRKRL